MRDQLNIMIVKLQILLLLLLLLSSLYLSDTFVSVCNKIFQCLLAWRFLVIVIYCSSAVRIVELVVVIFADVEAARGI